MKVKEENKVNNLRSLESKNNLNKTEHKMYILEEEIQVLEVTKETLENQINEKKQELNDFNEKFKKIAPKNVQNVVVIEHFVDLDPIAHSSRVVSLGNEKSERISSIDALNLLKKKKDLLVEKNKKKRDYINSLSKNLGSLIKVIF